MADTSVQDLNADKKDDVDSQSSAADISETSSPTESSDEDTGSATSSVSSENSDKVGESKVIDVETAKEKSVEEPEQVNEPTHVVEAAVDKPVEEPEKVNEPVHAVEAAGDKPVEEPEKVNEPIHAVETAIDEVKGPQTPGEHVEDITQEVDTQTKEKGPESTARTSEVVDRTDEDAANIDGDAANPRDSSRGSEDSYSPAEEDGPSGVANESPRSPESNDLHLAKAATFEPQPPPLVFDQESSEAEESEGLEIIQEDEDEVDDAEEMPTTNPNIMTAFENEIEEEPSRHGGDLNSNDTTGKGIEDSEPAEEIDGGIRESEDAPREGSHNFESDPQGNDKQRNPPLGPPPEGSPPPRKTSANRRTGSGSSVEKRLVTDSIDKAAYSIIAESASVEDIVVSSAMDRAMKTVSWTGEEGGEEKTQKSGGNGGTGLEDRPRTAPGKVVVNDEQSAVSLFSQASLFNDDEDYYDQDDFEGEKEGDQDQDIEVVEAAGELGLEATDQELFWIAREFLAESGKAPWIRCVDGNEKRYYYNSELCTSVWLHPLHDKYATLAAFLKNKPEYEDYDDNDKIITAHSKHFGWSKALVNHYVTTPMPGFWQVVVDEVNGNVHYQNSKTLDVTAVNPKNEIFQFINGKLDEIKQEQARNAELAAVRPISETGSSNALNDIDGFGYNEEFEDDDDFEDDDSMADAPRKRKKKEGEDDEGQTENEGENENEDYENEGVEDKDQGDEDGETDSNASEMVRFPLYVCLYQKNSIGTPSDEGILGYITVTEETTMAETREMVALLDHAPESFRFIHNNAPMSSEQETVKKAAECIPMLFVEDCHPNAEKVSNRSMKRTIAIMSEGEEDPIGFVEIENRPTNKVSLEEMRHIIDNSIPEIQRPYLFLANNKPVSRFDEPAMNAKDCREHIPIKYMTRIYIKENAARAKMRKSKKTKGGMFNLGVAMEGHSQPICFVRIRAEIPLSNVRRILETHMKHIPHFHFMDRGRKVHKENEDHLAAMDYLPVVCLRPDKISIAEMSSPPKSQLPSILGDTSRLTNRPSTRASTMRPYTQQTSRQTQRTTARLSTTRQSRRSEKSLAQRSAKWSPLPQNDSMGFGATEREHKNYRSPDRVTWELFPRTVEFLGRYLDDKKMARRGEKIEEEEEGEEENNDVNSTV